MRQSRVKGQRGYQVIFNAQYCEAEKTALFSNTATEFYRLKLGCWLIDTPGLVPPRIEFQEGCGSIAGASRDLARARPLGDAKQQAHHQVAKEQPGKLLGHPGRVAAEKSGRLRPGHDLP